MRAGSYAVRNPVITAVQNLPSASSASLAIRENPRLSPDRPFHELGRVRLERVLEQLLHWVARLNAHFGVVRRVVVIRPAFVPPGKAFEPRPLVHVEDGVESVARPNERIALRLVQVVSEFTDHDRAVALELTELLVETGQPGRERRLVIVAWLLSAVERKADPLRFQTRMARG
jgi:hypothetical protein